jgi:hypothetical protein
MPSNIKNLIDTVNGLKLRDYRDVENYAEYVGMLKMFHLEGALVRSWTRR